MRVLVVQASPRGERSVSRALLRGFADALGAGATIDPLDVWAQALPEFDAAGVGVKYKRIAGQALDDHEARVAETVDALIARFRAADAIAVGVPMWNWSIPYRLKQLIDLVTQRGALFDVTAGAYVPRLSIPRGLVVGVRGQDRDAGFAQGGPVTDADHHVGYVRLWLSAIGVARIDTVMADHGWDDGLAQSRERARTALTALAHDWRAGRARDAGSGDG